MNDYRYTKYENKSDYKTQKCILEKEIQENSSFRIMLNAVKDIRFHRGFQNVYDRRCCYCGVPISVAGESNYDIDHITCESFCSESDLEPHTINNLALSCRSCNLAKSNFIVYGSNYSLLSPDENIHMCLERESDYTIRVKSEYQDHTDVSEFYKKLKLGRNVHRVDYLINVLMGFSNTCNKEKKTQIGNLIQKLLIIRNSFYRTL